MAKISKQEKIKRETIKRRGRNRGYSGEKLKLYIKSRFKGHVRKRGYSRGPRRSQ